MFPATCFIRNFKVIADEEKIDFFKKTDRKSDLVSLKKGVNKMVVFALGLSKLLPRRISNNETDKPF